MKYNVLKFLYRPSAKLAEMGKSEVLGICKTNVQWNDKENKIFWVKKKLKCNQNIP
jgi:hypothetical protein